jgi:hypothetical protein
MSIVEAVTGELPYGMVDDEEVINQVASGEGYPRPAGLFTDRQWSLVQKLTAFKKDDRMKLEDAIKVLEDLVAEVKHVQDATIPEGSDQQKPETKYVECVKCDHENVVENKFCGKCGGFLGDVV